MVFCYCCEWSIVNIRLPHRYTYTKTTKNEIKWPLYHCKHDSCELCGTFALAQALKIHAFTVLSEMRRMKGKKQPIQRKISTFFFHHRCVYFLFFYHFVSRTIRKMDSSFRTMVSIVILPSIFSLLFLFLNLYAHRCRCCVCVCFISFGFGCQLNVE